MGLLCLEGSKKMIDIRTNLFKKTWKVLITILFVGVITMSEAACATPFSEEEVAKKLLFEKYNEDFEIETVQGGGGILDGYTNVVAYPVDNPNLPFMVHIDGDGSGMSDNYVSRIICEEMADIIAQNLDGLKGVYYVHSAMTIESWNLDNPNMTIKEYLNSNPEDRFVIYLAYCPDGDDADNYYENISKMFSGIEEVDGNVRLYKCDEGMLIKMQDYFENNDKAYDDFNSMCSPYYLGKSGIKNGKLEATKEEITVMFNSGK